MYVKKLSIKNFRCFADAEVELNYPASNANLRKLSPPIANVTLFVGANDSGKTSVFQAASLAVLARVIPNSGLRIDHFVRRQSGSPPMKSVSPKFLDADIQADLIVNSEDADPLP